MNKKAKSDDHVSPIMSIQEFNLGNAEINKKLEKFVLEDMQKHKGITKEQHSNIGGWQSERDLHAKLGDGTPYHSELLRLFASFSSPITQFINKCCVQCNVKPNATYDWDYSDAWFNVAAQGGYNAPHAHPLSEISGAYYVRTTEPPEGYPFSGRIDFYYQDKNTHFFPKPGTLILFPGDMLHFVHPYYGAGHRICLSFNIKNVHIVE